MDESKIYGQKEFNLPHDVVKLPSKGLFYKSKKGAVKVGYLTAADENLLLAGGESVILNLLRNKIYESDLKPDELLQGDIQAILIFLRNTAFGPEYRFSINDPDTMKNFESTISLEELYLKKTEVEPNDDGTFSTILPKSGISVKLRPLSFGELSELDDMASKYPNGRVAPKQTWRLNKMIVEMMGTTDRSTISQNIETLPISDAKYIRKFIEDNEPGLELTKQIKAPSGKEVYVNISFGAEFFRPFF